jgi:surfactin synthase thioesterase subunit
VPKIVLEQAELRSSLVPALRADLALTETYVYRAAPRLDCAIRAYAGAADPIISEARLSAWREQTTGEFSMRLFDGHHFYLNRARDSLLADLLAQLFGNDPS